MSGFEAVVLGKRKPLSIQERDVIRVQKSQSVYEFALKRAIKARDAAQSEIDSLTQQLTQLV